jgi:ABC-type branched-subunit amino acid transport system ATPase component
MPAILETQQVTRHFGGIMALASVSLSVEEGSISAVIGPNGAGKTTFFNLCCGVYPPTQGRILLAGQTISGRPPYWIARRGLARTFQNIQLFTKLTLIENVLVGCEARDYGSGFLATMLRLPGVDAREDAARTHALELLDLVGLHKRGDALAGSLSFGQQRILEIARALATRPRLLLLDEPAAGLSGPERQALAEVVQRIRAQGVTVLLVEHDMQLVMTLADHVAVLNYGELIAAGPPAAIQNDPQVITAYLGDEA